MIIISAIIALCFVLFACGLCFFAGFYIRDIKGTVIYRNTESQGSPEENKVPIEKQRENILSYNGRNKGGQSK